MKYTFGDDQAVTYAEYLDVEQGRTLVAEPGNTYDIAQAAGITRPGADGEHGPVTLPMPPDERWAPAKATKTTKEQG